MLKSSEEAEVPFFPPPEYIEEKKHQYKRALPEERVRGTWVVYLQKEGAKLALP
jgi:hypothetical protein